MRKRKFVVKCKSDELCLELLNKITENISSRFIKSEVKGNTLQLEVIGLPYELKEIKYEIEMLKREVERTTLNESDYKYLKLDELGKTFRGTISLDVLINVLKLKGYSANVKDDKLYTNAPIQLIQEIIDRAQELYGDETVRFKLSSSAKRVILIFALAFERTPSEILEILKSNNLLEQSSFRYQLRENSEVVINKLMKLLKTPQ